VFLVFPKFLYNNSLFFGNIIFLDFAHPLNLIFPVDPEDFESVSNAAHCSASLFANGIVMFMVINS